MKRRILSMMLALLMCLSMLSLCACSSENADASANQVETQAVTEAQKSATDLLWENATYVEDVTLGEGKTKIFVAVSAGEKNIVVTINTDAKTLQDALTSVDLIQGEESEYGLYIKTVNGILADYDIDQSYWAINKDGEYMMEGANTVEITSGDNFELVYTK